MICELDAELGILSAEVIVAVRVYLDCEQMGRKS
jgi:hypothetical protein